MKKSSPESRGLTNPHNEYEKEYYALAEKALAALKVENDLIRETANPNADLLALTDQIQQAKQEANRLIDEWVRYLRDNLKHLVK